MHILKPYISERVRRVSLLMIIALGVGLVSCGEDVEESVKFALIVRNNTSNDYNIYGKTDVENGDFALFGSVRAGGARSVAGLIIEVNYTFRLTQANDPDAFDFETKVTSTGKDEPWTVP